MMKRIKTDLIKISILSVLISIFIQICIALGTKLGPRNVFSRIAAILLAPVFYIYYNFRFYIERKGEFEIVENVKFNSLEFFIFTAFFYIVIVTISWFAIKFVFKKRHSKSKRQ